MAFDLDDDELEATKNLNGLDSKENRSKLHKQIIDQKKIKNKKEQEQLTKMKTELLKKEYQDNLKKYLEEKEEELVYKLKNLKEGKKLSVIELKSLLSQKNFIGISPKYGTAELAILFEYYKHFIQEINEKTIYIPTKEDFCSFIGISTHLYNSWKRSDDRERREIMQKIDDYLVDIHLSMAQRGDIKEITSIFRAKAEFGLVEAQAPQIVKHEMESDMKQILANIDAINAGKSLKSIESVKGEDGIYRPKEE